MKKRAMKKWIPKNTIYCYKQLTKDDICNFMKGSFISIKICPWYKVVKRYDKEYNEYYNEAFCKYCGKSDVGCLDDQCKICGEHEE